MNKQEHIDYWKSTAAWDWTFVQQAFKIKQYVYALFFAHLVLEKLCKAHWVKDNKSNYPPRIHNLVRLIEETKLNFSEQEMEFFRKLNDFQLEGRYPDYKQELYKVYKKHNSDLILKKINELRLCLLKKLH